MVFHIWEILLKICTLKQLYLFRSMNGILFYCLLVLVRLKWKFNRLLQAVSVFWLSKILCCCAVGGMEKLWGNSHEKYDWLIVASVYYLETKICNYLSPWYDSSNREAEFISLWWLEWVCFWHVYSKCIKYNILKLGKETWDSLLVQILISGGIFRELESRRHIQ